MKDPEGFFGKSVDVSKARENKPSSSLQFKLEWNEMLRKNMEATKRPSRTVAKFILVFALGFNLGLLVEYLIKGLAGK